MDVMRSCSRALDADGWSNEELYVIYLGRGVAYGQMGDHYDAIDDYAQAMSLFPQRGLTYHLIGGHLQWLGEYWGAVEMYSEGIDADPKYGGNYIARILIACMLGQNIDVYSDVYLFFSTIPNGKFLGGIQETLQSAGFYSGPIDGLRNEATVEAYRRAITVECLACRTADCETQS
ncbi:MAG: tetratricopeptide repeat protein [Pseudomonadota bacterium]